MNFVTIVWSGAAAAAFLLALVHAAVWFYDRSARSSAALAIVAFSLVGVAFCELGMMGSQTPEEFLLWIRWCQLPLFFLISFVPVFVRTYFGTGKTWLMWSVIATRAAILVINFAAPASFNFSHVASLHTGYFLGSQISLVGESVTGPWQWLATLNCLLFLAFIVDATRSHWAKGDAESRRNAVVIGGSVLLFATVSVLSTQLAIWHVAVVPMLVTPPYLFILLAMAFELSRDTLRARSLLIRLRESDNRLELAVDAAQLGLWSWESGGVRLWATARARQCFGFGEEEPVELAAVRARVHPDDYSRLLQGLEASVRRAEPWRAEFRVCAPPAEALRWISVQGQAVVDPHGKLTLVRGVLRDISGQKQAQAESDELRREVNHAGRVSMLGQLSSSLAHELSQPLGAILRNVEAAEILLDSPHPDLVELRAIVSDIHKDDRRAGDIIDRLRALLKRRQLQFQPLAIDSLVNDVSSLVRADAASRHIEFACATEQNLPPVSGDRVHLSQVLINLILNGMDSIDESADPRRRVELAARPRDALHLEICVTDTGCGIRPDALARVFDPFYTTKEGGMGMGLAVSRAIVEAHGGQLLAANGSGGGAVFTIVLAVSRGLP